MIDLLRFTIAGIALGAQYALIVLGFVVIFRASGVLNFALGGMILLGAYLAYTFHVLWGLPFGVGCVLAVAAGAAFGALVEWSILRRMIGRPVYGVIMATLGLLLVIQEVVVSIWGPASLNLGDPWGIRTIALGELRITVHDVWTIGLAAVAVAAFFVVFRFTRMGLAMRAVAIDQEAARAQGVNPRRVFAVSWAIAGAVATLAGVTAAAGSSNLQPGVANLALSAVPAMVLGGLESPLGAVLGGVIIGVTQTLTAAYQAQYLPFLGTGFEAVMPYVVLVAVLLIRPYGLFGAREVRRA